MTRRQPVDRVVAVHEAGHAVGRILVAESLGWGAEEALKYIAIHPVPLLIGVSAELHPLEAQAATWGPFLSRPMFEYLQTRMSPEEIDAERDGAAMRALFSEMRAAGLDLDVWFRARCIQTVFGPMAEAKLTGRSFDEVLRVDGSKGDLGDLIYAGFIRGIAEEHFAEAASQQIEIAKRYIARPEVWRAILTLADKIKLGRMDGRVAAAIITRELGTPLDDQS
jgi:hypothetical protein